MTIQELSNKVRECIAYKLEMPLSKVTEEDNLVADLGADSQNMWAGRCRLFMAA